MNFNELTDIDWTFPNANTQYSTHGFHKYPARMPPQIPNKLISYFKCRNIINNNSLIYDPFAGSGTTLVESRLHNINTIGNDVNPFACLLSKAKSTRINPNKISNVWTKESTILKNNINSTDVIDEEDIPNIRNGWFPQPQLSQLICIRNWIDNLNKNKNIKRIFRIALAETTRETSYQRNGEFKRYRMSKENRKTHNPNVWKIFSESLEDKIPKIKSFYENTTSNEKTTVLNKDSRNIDFIINSSIDLIITSPPYGDHQTTVAYGQFSQDPGIIANNYGYDEMKQIDKDGLGGINKYNKFDKLNSNALQQTIDKLQQKDGRNIDAINFFMDYYEVLKECYKVLKNDKYMILVVANRTMSRINIPTHIISKQLCEDIGFNFMINIPRDIPNRTMPLSNAPENIKGHKGKLMSNEHILIFQK